MTQKIKFAREDAYNPASDFSNSIQEKWIHKEVVKMTGDSEDDFVIEEKPVLVDRIDLKKRIQEEAKTTDLKYLLKQFLQTGDESILNVRPGFYGDITGIQNLVTGGEFASAEQIKESLGSDFAGLTVDQIAKMSNEDLAVYIAQVKKQASEAKVKEDKPEDKPEQAGGVE